MSNVVSYDVIASKIETVIQEFELTNEEAFTILSMMANRIMQEYERNKINRLPSFIIDGVCKITEFGGDYICNLGYACDGCPHNKDGDLNE